MSVGIADLADTDTSSDGDTFRLKVTSVEYTEQSNRPIIHIFGVDTDGQRRHVEVEGHRPSFYIEADEYDRTIDNHYAVYDTEHGYENLHGDDVVRIYTYLPGQVADMRDLFDRTYEADVFYVNRFLIDTGVYNGVEIDTSDAIDEGWVQGEFRVDVDALEPCEPPTVDPTMLTLDIEVAGEDGVPDADRGTYPVSTIVASSGQGRYVGWLLEHDRHDGVDVDATGLDELRTFADESNMLHNFNEWVGLQEPDILTGWYSNDFDIPYLVNRCKTLNVYNYSEWSPLGEVFITRYTPVVKGVECVDMLEAYKKTQYHNLKSKKLESVAQKEVGEGKDYVDDHTEMWKRQPTDFLRYNKVDVELVQRIEHAAVDNGLIGFLENLRTVVGCSYVDPLGGNIDMMDMLFLRKAKEYGYALPTAVEPDEGYYHGAYVFTPVPGIHEHVVYPDYSGLYPNIMYQCNISPETLIGTAEDLEASPYDEDDCVWSYIDDTTPPPLKEDVEAKEERMEKVYFLKPSVKEGFIRSVLGDIMGMCDEYVGGLYAAAKRVRNSSYGVLGDSDSYGVGFRLFDWRLAEATTLGGQKVLKDGAGRFLDELADLGHENANLVGGDSVPANEPTLIRRGGDVQIVSIEDVKTGDEVWTDDGWSGVKNVIKKPNEKKLYTVWTKHGISHVTEDHGLIRDNGNEVTPTDVEGGEPLLHHDIANVDVSGMKMEEQRAWLLGLFAAEGSCGIYEAEGGSKASWAINNQDRELLEHAQEILSDTFGIPTKIDNVMESSNTLKLRLHRSGDNASVVLGFREMLYDGTEKRVPKEVLNGAENVQRAFIAGHHAGDGHIAHDHKEFDEIWTKHKHLAAGLVFLLRQLDHTVSIHVRAEQSDEFYRIRSVAFTQGNDDEILGIEEYDYNGEYVYDLETENQHFQSGVGSMVVHNTDSVMTAMPDAESKEDAKSSAVAAAGTVNQWLNEYTVDTFGLDNEAEARMELEIESYASRLFFKAKDGESTKKRYVQLIEWNDDDGWLDEPEIGIKGFEYVRSDVADVTDDVQFNIFTAIMKYDLDDAEEWSKAYVEQMITDIIEDNIDIGRFGVPFGISQSLDKYGGADSRPLPWYRGAKYANQEIYGGDAITEGADAVYYYVEEGKTGDRKTYSAHTAEDGDYVDCVSVLEPQDLPEGCRIDRPKMAEKTVIDPLIDICETLGWGTEWMYEAKERATPPEYHRDDDQQGLGAWECF